MANQQALWSWKLEVKCEGCEVTWNILQDEPDSLALSWRLPRLYVGEITSRTTYYEFNCQLCGHVTLCDFRIHPEMNIGTTPSRRQSIKTRIETAKPDSCM